MIATKNNFFGGINQQVDAHKIDFATEYYLGINVRVRDNVVRPVAAPANITAGLPASGRLQGVFVFDDYILAFKGGLAYYKQADAVAWDQVGTLALDANVEYIYATPIPASTVNFKRAAVDEDDAKSDQRFFSTTQTTPECLFVTDGVNQPWIIFPDGSARITKNYDQWTPDDAEYAPICILPAYVNGILYCVGKDSRGRFNQIYRSVPGRPLDFVILLKSDGNKLDGGEPVGGAPALAHRVSYGEMTALQPIPAQQGALYAATARGSWLVQPDFDNTIAGAPTFINVPLFNVGAVNQYAVTDILGDTAVVHYKGIRSFNGIMTQQNEGRNAAFNRKIDKLLGDIRQTACATAEFDNYSLFAVQTIHGPGILVYDQNLQQFVSLDLYEGVGLIKQFAVMTTPVNERLFFFDANGQLFEAFAGSRQPARLYLGELAATKQHRITGLDANFINSTGDGYAQVTIYSDRLRNGVGVGKIVPTDAPATGDFPLDQARTAPDLNYLHFNFADLGLAGKYCGALIEWESVADLSEVAITIEPVDIPAPGPDYHTAADVSTYRVVFVGDDGQVNADRIAVNRAIKLENANLIVGCGDHAYNNGTVAEVNANLKPYWDTLRAAGKFVAVPGNHDLDTAVGNAFFDYMRMTPSRYSKISLDYTDIFLVNSGYNTAGAQVEPDNLDGGTIANSRQARWLKEGLESSAAKHKIVVWHHPPYTSSASYGGGTAVRDAMRTLPIRSWGADALINGHSHHYERLEHPDGLVQLVSGAGGAPLYDFGTIDAYSQVRIKQFGYVLATITPLHVLFEFKNVNGEVLDRVQI